MAKTFDPKNVTIVAGGHIVGGYADGTFVTAERNRDAFSLTVGADGEGARAKSNDKSGRITLTLLQSSASNDVLSGYATAEEFVGGGGQFPIIIKDNSGTTLVEAATAWIVKKPAVEFGNEISDREWIIESDDLDLLVGGLN